MVPGPAGRWTESGNLLPPFQSDEGAFIERRALQSYGECMTADGSGGNLVSLRRPPIAARAVPAMIGYRMAPMPGVHRGLPSPYLTLVISLSGPLPIEIPWRAADSPVGHFGIPVGGLHTSPVLLPPPGGLQNRLVQRGIQLAVHPFACRALFAVPAAELDREVLELRELIGRDGAALGELLAGSVPSATAVERVNGWLTGRLAAVERGVVAPELRRAWQLITESGGTIRVGQVADDVGWSRRHLTAMMRAEIGIGVKDLARLTRFDRSKSQLLAGRLSLSDVAAACGYVDQSHLTAEWRQFAGCTPGQWLAAELPALTG